MAFFQRSGQPISSMITRFFSKFASKFAPVSGLFGVHGLRGLQTDDLLQSCEEFLAGLALAAIACYASEFVPYWVTLVTLAIGAWAVLSDQLGLDGVFPVATRSALTVIIGFVALSQPWAAMLFILVGTAWVTFTCYERAHHPAKISAAAVFTLLGSAVVYGLLSRLVLPFLHPLTVSLYNAGPLIAVIAGVLVTLYCAWRIKGDIDDRFYYKLAPGVCAALFAIFFPMKNTWVGFGAEWFFVALTFGLAFRGSRPLLIGGTSIGATFALAFVSLNGSSFLHDVAMAESMRVHEVQHLPATNNNRIMPIVVGRDFCVQGNDATMLETGEAHALIKDGSFYWQCPTHYTGFQVTHLFSWIPGSTAGFVMVNAGSTASDTRVNDRGFIFGENSAMVKAAFEARHPQGTMAGFSYATDASGSYQLVIPYTTKQLFWGAMVPTLGGVMTVSQWGIVEDYTVAEAARAFPGTFLYPAELARQYADVWGKREISKLIGRSSLEVSEPPQTAQGNLSNPFPYGIDTEAGRKYFIPYEPQGKNGTAMSDVAFFDGATGESDVEILHLASSDQAGEKNALGHRSIQGPKELLEKSANVVQGHFQLTSIEPIIVVTKAGRLYFITANMGPDKNKSNHDYQGDTLSFATGEPQWVITSSADAKKDIDAYEQSLDGASPQASPAVPAAAATPIVPPSPQDIAAPTVAPSTQQ